MDNNNGSMKDLGSSLIWTKCSYGQNNDANCTGTPLKTSWSLALQYCKSINIGGLMWRLPNLNESVSLIYPNRNFSISGSSPNIDILSFPSTPLGNYWTSTTSPPYGSIVAHYLNNNSGSISIGGTNKAYSAYVRCVSGP